MTIRSKKRKAQRRGQVTETTGNQPAVTEDDSKKGIGELLRDPKLVRSDLAMLRNYMGCGVFTEEQIEGMVMRIGSIIANGTNRERIAAFKTLLAQTKLSYDMANGRSSSTHVHQHGHLHVNAHEIGADLAEIASEIGIEIGIEETGGEAGDILQGQSWGPQQEDGSRALE